ncbi:carbohydrate ABC transporter substrate-binding protein (CUT1 family) [Hydrogenispora ethanolica]|jgi:putative aldouronate transport system substrate-binding protein|uniref:Carbohydrate ABC transporter substrate-binding protein (CUT1 family) n=1 Tax=Hydrogenispora ethanolica TaxID=1082276 RepID=A0A4R1S1Z6_HYDET|nr:extracellular solute-binding protein [Hydrogenispora ethanolica]TCL73183.1 carbohydrate ABC transporter substrate-binding protein (CUT1 family) [Hydrogenispora ethanolica]
MKKFVRLMVWVALLGVLATGLFANSGALAANEAVPLRIMTDWWVATIPSPDWPEWKAVEKRLGIKLQMEFNMNFSIERLSTMIASGNIPDATLINLQTTPAGYDWINQGAFQPVEKSLRKYAPHLWKALAPGAIQLGSVNGVLYGVPRPRATARECFAIRKDWLDKLKLPVPKTMDDLEKVLKAFVTRDPDGNGRNDTFGFGGENFNTFMVPFFAVGNPYQFAYDSKGQVQYNGISPDAKEGLATLQRWYKEGLIDPDMPTQPGLYSAKVAAAKTGVITPWLDQLRPSEFNPVPQNWQQMRANDPKAQWVMVPILSSSRHKTPKHYQNAGTSSHFFVSSRLRDGKKLEKLFQWWDFWASKAGYEFGSWGLKGLDYEVDAKGNKSLTEEGKKRIYALQCFRQTHLWEAQMQIAADKPENNAIMAKMLKDLSKQSVPYPFIDVAARSKAYVNHWPELFRMQQEAYTQIIIGLKPVDSFDAFARQWRQAGGDELLREMNGIYKK